MATWSPEVAFYRDIHPAVNGHVRANGNGHRSLKELKAVVLAGGRGTRLAPYTHILPKPLMPIGDMPILEVLLRQMKRAGVEDVVLTVGHLASLLQAFFGDGHQWGLNIEYSYEQAPLGTAGPIALVTGLDDTFMVTNGDV